MYGGEAHSGAVVALNKLYAGFASGHRGIKADNQLTGNDMSVVSDDYVNSLFDGANFGAKINGDVTEKRKQIAKTLRNQVGGYWSGHTAYWIAVNGGFLIDGKRSTDKKLTELGRQFLAEQDPEWLEIPQFLRRGND